MNLFEILYVHLYTEPKLTRKYMSGSEIEQTTYWVLFLDSQVSIRVQLLKVPEMFSVYYVYLDIPDMFSVL